MEQVLLSILQSVTHMPAEGHKTSPQCRHAFLLSSDVSESGLYCRNDVSELEQAKRACWSCRVRPTAEGCEEEAGGSHDHHYARWHEGDRCQQAGLD